MMNSISRWEITAPTTRRLHPLAQVLKNGDVPEHEEN
jgi:hypothetical protein